MVVFLYGAIEGRILFRKEMGCRKRSMIKEEDGEKCRFRESFNSCECES